MKNNNISFIIPAYNCEKTIEESVKSVFNGNFTDGDEVIIINDASTDKTLEVSEKLKEKYPQIKIYSHNINKGSAAAGRNTGIDKSKNELLFCLDSDNILIPNSIKLLKEYMMNKKADIAAFGEMHYFIKNTKEISHKWIYEENIGLQDALSGVYWPGPSGNYLFTKSSWLRAGRYDESLGGAYDSWIFGIKQLATGSKMVTLKNSYYLHRCGYSSTFIRDEKKIKPSIIGLCTILPFLKLIEESDLEFIMSKENRETWLENLKNKPVRIKNKPTGINGNLINTDKTIISFKNMILNQLRYLISYFLKRKK